MKKFDAQQFLALAQRYRVAHTMLVPVQYQRLMAFSLFDSFDLSSFQMKFCTNAAFSAALKADVLKRWLGGLTDYYRMNEGGSTCILSAHLRPNKLSTVGQPASNRDRELTTLVDSRFGCIELQSQARPLLGFYQCTRQSDVAQ
jgi:long-chain acyl-CoA synthetase